MADAGINGLTSDGGVLGNTALRKALVDKLLQIPEPGTLSKSEKKVTVTFVGDDACVLTENFIKPSGHAGQVARMGEERGVCRVLVGKPEGRKTLGRPRRRWVDNIRMDLQEVGCGYMDWTGLAQDRDRWRTLVSAVMNIRVP